MYLDNESQGFNAITFHFLLLPRPIELVGKGGRVSCVCPLQEWTRGVRVLPSCISSTSTFFTSSNVESSKKSVWKISSTFNGYVVVRIGISIPYRPHFKYMVLLICKCVGAGKGSFLVCAGGKWNGLINIISISSYASSSQCCGNCFLFS